MHMVDMHIIISVITKTEFFITALLSFDFHSFFSISRKKSVVNIFLLFLENRRKSGRFTMI